MSIKVNKKAPNFLLLDQNNNNIELYNNDFYEGIFQSNFTWCADYDQSSGECNDFIRDPNPSQYSNFDYGYMNGPLGFTWGINWSKW